MDYERVFPKTSSFALKKINLDPEEMFFYHAEPDTACATVYVAT